MKYSKLSQDEQESAAIELLNQPIVQKRMLNLISKALKAKGLDVTVDSLTIEQTDASPTMDSDKSINALYLSEEMENVILKALASFLREKM